MSSTDRLLLFIIALGLGFYGLVLGAGMLGHLSALTSYLHYLRTGPRWEALAASAVTVAASVYLLSLALRTKAERSVSRETSLGHVRISFKAVESMVLRAAAQVRGIRDVVATVDASAQGLEVSIDASAGPDLSVPEIAEDLQQRVKEHVEASVGMPVTSVRVNIGRLATDGKARVE